MELLGERIGLEGQRQQLQVPCEAPGITDPFQSLLSGVAQMRELVTEFFGSQHVGFQFPDQRTTVPLALGAWSLNR
ncbi:hypothetical protein JEQ12_001106 [Ovis aries]|uniref:Uncharacterized protein n=1 Tax=Ovis aries TaxID=9940 RepID=A0A836AGN3_SHEEP|nr:hypothetical protein JEQ12_001106 [Ovis aries]